MNAQGDRVGRWSTEKTHWTDSRPTQTIVEESPVGQVQSTPNKPTSAKKNGTPQTNAGEKHPDIEDAVLEETESRSCKWTTKY